MNVSHIIEDLESIISVTPETESYGLAFASYLEDGSGNIELKDVEAFEWHDDEEFFLVPAGTAQYFNLEPRHLTATGFLAELKGIQVAIGGYTAYAKSRVKVAKDGSVASLNSPLWGTGYHMTEKLVYFYHGKRKNS